MNLTSSLAILVFATSSLAAPMEAFSDDGDHFVKKRYYCRTINDDDEGDVNIEADGPSCAASRAAIEEVATGQSGDPCTDREPNRDPPLFTNPDKPAEELQDSGSCSPE